MKTKITKYPYSRPQIEQVSPYYRDKFIDLDIMDKESYDKHLIDLKEEKANDGWYGV